MWGESMSFIGDLPKSGNVLIISNNCGGGHEQACNYVERKMDQECPMLNSHRIEFLEFTFGSIIASRVSENWSKTQKKEDVLSLNQYLDIQWMDTVFLSAWVFIKYFFYFLGHSIDVVIDTQPVSLQAIIRAARVASFVRSFFGSSKPPIQVKLIMTELPNAKTKNFFYPVSWLTDNDKKNFELITSRPLVKNGQTEAEFWKEHCNLSLEHVVYSELPIRPAFHEYADREDETSELSALFSTEEEREMMAECYGEGFGELPSDNGRVVFPLQPNDQVCSIMLGSQACTEATKQYVKKSIFLAKERGGASQNQYLFVLCGRHKDKQSLFQQVHDLVRLERGRRDYPEHLKIVPLTFQTDAEIAPLLRRSNLSVTKSGGLTAMEQLAVARGQILLHATPPKDLDPCEMTDDDIAKTGMPLWEWGNAEVLEVRKGALPVTPESFLSAVRKGASLPIRRARASRST